MERAHVRQPMVISRLGTFGARLLCLSALAILNLTGLGVSGPSPVFAASTPQTHTNATPTTATNSPAIPSTEIPAQAESDTAELRAIETESSSDAGVDVVESQLPLVSEEIDNRSEEDAGILARSRSLDLFAKMAVSWQDVNQELSGWKRNLARRSKQLQTNLSHVEQMEKRWELTRNSATNVPPELSKRMDTVLGELKQAHQQVQKQLAKTLMLQDKLTEQDARIRDSLTAIDQARQQVVRNLLVRDSPPLWSGEILHGISKDITEQSHHSIARQWQAVTAFCQRKPERFAIQLGIFVGLAMLFLYGRRKLTQLGATSQDLAPEVHGFDVPVGSALLITLLLGPLIYPQAPRLLSSIVGTLALFPAVVVLRRLLSRDFFPILNALVVLYLLDQFRVVGASQIVLSRFLFLAEMGGGLVFCCLMLRSIHQRSTKTGNSLPRGLPLSLRVSGAIFGAALVANIVGYGRLSALAGSVLLVAADLGLILCALVRVGDTLLRFIFRASPLARVGMIGRHWTLLAKWGKRVLEWVAVLVWLCFVLQKLALRHSLWTWLTKTLNTRFSIGSLSFSVLHVGLFWVTIWAAFVVSRVVRFVLEEEVYPHVRLAEGLHYSISKTVHYLVLLIGFLLALVLLGFNLTKLTVLAGAFGVGLGFGLQNIVNNFVSGLILLFERPVKVGDLIQLDSTEGVVERIGIRASIIKTLSGSEIIVPNGKLTSDPVTNWTFSHHRRLITLPVAVGSDAKPDHVIKVLTKVATAHPLVSKKRPIQALLTNLADGTANFELGAWIDKPEVWQQVRSDLLVSIKSSLAAERIPMR